MKKIILSSLLFAALAQADGFSKTIYAKVSSSEPVFETVTEYIPIETCEDVKEAVRQDSGAGNVIGTLAGGVLGGVLGHQFGGGTGKMLMTAGGAATGAYIGNQMSAPDANGPTSQIVKKCYTKQLAQEKRVLRGYKNKAIVDGKEISVFAPQQIEQIPVTVSFDY